MLPIPGLNLSTPVYAFVALLMLGVRLFRALGVMLVSGRGRHKRLHGRALPHVGRIAGQGQHKRGELAGRRSPLTITAIVPAYNEEDGLSATLEALLDQTDPFDRIIVADDASTDRTREVALSYRVSVITPPQNLGSKARAQNHVLPFCSTDLVLPVDADTVLAPNYVELIKKPFADPDVVIAAGCVLTRHSRSWTERGRTLEYLFGFHWHRPIQNAAASPVVCSGCNSAFRRAELEAFGGFPERTIVEDMDYTWSQQVAGKRAVYVGEAVAYAADPENLKYLRKQVWRCMAGFFQNVRGHAVGLVQRKRMLALWVFLAVWEIMTVPLWYAMPFVWFFVLDWPLLTALAWFFGAEFALLAPPLIYGATRRGVSLWHVLACVPALYAVKGVNFVYAWKALVVELVLVPMGLSQGLHDYEKGREDTPQPTPAPQLAA